MITPLITTIIPTYNRSHLLPNALKSIQSQTYTNFVVYILDNASTDNTKVVAEEYVKSDDRIHYFRHEKNLGLIENFNFGILKVATPLFHLISDDDFIEPGFYEISVRELTTHPKAMFFAGATLHCDATGEVFGNPLNKWQAGLQSPPNGFEQMIKFGHPDWTGIIFRKSVLKFITFDPSVGYAADYDFLLKIAAKMPIFISKMPVAKFYLQPSSESFKSNLHSFWPGWKKLIQNIAELNEIDTHFKKLTIDGFKKRLIKKILRCAIKSISIGNINQAILARNILLQEFDKPIMVRLIDICIYLQKNSISKSILRRFVIFGALFRRRTGLYKF